MKKGRHRRYEEARKFQRATAERFAVEDYDFDDSDRFGVALDEDDTAPDDQYGHLADKYDHYFDGELSDDSFSPFPSVEHGDKNEAAKQVRCRDGEFVGDADTSNGTDASFGADAKHSPDRQDT